MIDAFLRLTNDSDQLVEGESADKGFERVIEIRDFSLGERATGSGGSIGLSATSTDTGNDVSGQIDSAMAGTREAFLAELQKAAAANLKRQKLTDIRRKTETSFQSGLMQVKSLVTDEVLKHAADRESGERGDRLTFKITKDVDAASADLFQAYCSTVRQPNPNPQFAKLGEFQTAEITLRKMYAGVVKPYLVCTFSDVSITAFDLSFDSTRVHVIETVTFKFVRYKMRYQSQDAAGAAGSATPETSGSIGTKQDQ